MVLVLSSYAQLSLPEYFRDLLLAEPLRFTPKQSHELLVGLPNLVSYGHEAPGEVVVVFRQQPIRDLDIINVVKYQCPLGLVLVLGLDDGRRVVTPVTPAVQVVRGVVAVIEAVTVTLDGVLAREQERQKQKTHLGINQGYTRAEI